MNQNKGHILAVTYPLQGHAAPMVKLSQKIAEQGVKVTFVTTEFTSATISESIRENSGDRIRLVSIPDGLEPGDNRKDEGKVWESLRRVMGGELEKILVKANKESDEVSGVVVDVPLGWVLDIPKRMGIKTGVYWGSTPGCLALGLKIPQLIEANVIDNQGKALKNEKLQLLPDFPPISPTQFPWHNPHDPNKQNSIFQSIKSIVQTISSSDHYILTNWFPELTPSNLIPNLFPVGPLLSNGKSSGSFCPEDSSCLIWLDKQAPSSVIYVAFGSTSRFGKDQVDELAKGLELIDRPFLWVAWSGLTNENFSLYSQDFVPRLGDRGKIVEWAPQESVLTHPAIACFVTHCGWSSTMESLICGVPFLCWPYFGDQLYTQTCICATWKVGLSLNPGQNGIIYANEIKNKVGELMSAQNIKENAQKFKHLALNSISENGSSTKNLECLVEQMKY